MAICFFLTLSGFAASLVLRLGLANPFTIYYGIWSAIFLQMLMMKEDLIEPSVAFWIFLASSFTLSWLLMILASICHRSHGGLPNRGLDSVGVKKHVWAALQILVVIALPFAYFRAVEMAADDIFTVEGYISLRGSMTDYGGSPGVYAYISVISLILTAASFVLFYKKKINIGCLLISILITLMYSYLGTGRTYILMFLCVSVLPIWWFGKLGKFGIVITATFLLVSFYFVSYMTAKGMSPGGSFEENFNSFLQTVGSYTVAPTLALSELIVMDKSTSFGSNTFRVFYAVLDFIGIGDSKPVALIKDYQFVPMPTNVYTVYEVYFNDFGVISCCIPPMFLMLHWYLYLNAVRVGGRWILFYLIGLYPLLLQFFQDQYFSLISLWAQIAFWIFVVFVNVKSSKVLAGKV